MGRGIAGYVATTGQSVNVPEAYADSRFHRDVDQGTGYRTHGILCVPMRAVTGLTTGVLQALNKRHGTFAPVGPRARTRRRGLDELPPRCSPRQRIFQPVSRPRSS